MADSFQKEKPPARINLFLEVLKGDAKKKVELPLRTCILGDFTGKESTKPLADREKVNVNKDNFQKIMKSSELGLEYTVPDRLKGEDEEMKVELNFDDLDSFHPEQVARQVPALGKLLSTRNLLQDLRNRLISTRDFRKQLEEIVKDKDALEKLSGQLDKIVTGEAPVEDSES
jgi:type VI secretion system protein ImpB